MVPTITCITFITFNGNTGNFGWHNGDSALYQSSLLGTLSSLFISLFISSHLHTTGINLHYSFLQSCELVNLCTFSLENPKKSVYQTDWCHHHYLIHFQNFSDHFLRNRKTKPIDFMKWDPTKQNFKNEDIKKHKIRWVSLLWLNGFFNTLFKCIYIFFYPNICNILFADEETSPPPVPPKLAGRRKSGEIFKLVMQMIFVSTEK